MDHRSANRGGLFEDRLQNRGVFRCRVLGSGKEGQCRAKEESCRESYFIPEEEFLNAMTCSGPWRSNPCITRRVRVVEIHGFDAQACGGTHVSTTAEVGTFSVFQNRKTRERSTSGFNVRLGQPADN